MTIGDRLKKLRLERNFTLEEVSKQLNFSRQTLQRYESGVITNIPSNKIEGLARIFSVSPAYIMGWEDSIPSNEENFEISNIVAHIDGDPLSEKEQEEVINFIKFIKSKRSDS